MTSLSKTMGKFRVLRTLTSIKLDPDNQEF